MGGGFSQNEINTTAFYQSNKTKLYMYPLKFWVCKHPNLKRFLGKHSKLYHPNSLGNYISYLVIEYEHQILYCTTP